MKQIELVPLSNPINSKITIPGSKSYTNRALLLAALTTGKVTITDALFSEDTEAMMGCLEGLGIYIEKDNDKITVDGDITQIKDSTYNLNAKFSGTTIRFILALCCVIPGTKILIGEEGLNNRPIGDLVNALRELGADIEFLEKEGFSPLKINGKIMKRKLFRLFPVQGDRTKITVKGEVSSQFLSAVLMVSPLIGEVEVEVLGNLISKPYVEMTLDIMEKFGVKVKKSGGNKYLISKAKYQSNNYRVEGDFSSAGYFLGVAALTKSAITVDNLNPNSKQADKEFLEILERMGNKITATKDSVKIEGVGVTPIEVDMTNCPDQVQTLAVLASFAKGITKITGIKSLRVKETDRVKALEKELKKIGIKTEVKENSITIYGGDPIPSEIDTYNDHRMAMSFAIAGAKIKGIKINNPEVVNKTFPGFWNLLNQIGVKNGY